MSLNEHDLLLAADPDFTYGHWSRRLALAQAQRDPEEEFNARLGRLAYTVHHGRVTSALEDLDQLLPYAKTHPGSSQVALMPCFEAWAKGYLHEFPAMSLGVIRNAIEECVAYMRATHGPSAAQAASSYLWFKNHLGCGRTAQSASELNELLRDANSRGHLSLCDAYLRHMEVEIAVAAGSFKEAVEKAQPILNGEMRCPIKPCDHVPKRAVLALLWAAMVEGDWRYAGEMFERGLPLIRNQSGTTEEMASALVFLTAKGRLEEAIELAADNLRTALRLATPRAKFKYGAALEALGLRVRESGGPPFSLKAAIPDALKVDCSTPAQFFEWLTGWMDNLETAFNKRNGNEFFTENRMKFHFLGLKRAT